MKDLFIKFKTRIVAAFVVVLMGVAMLATDQKVDWSKLLQDALRGEVTDTAQKVEDAAG